MSILITGGTGFLGSQLAHLLVDRGEDIILFDVQFFPDFGRNSNLIVSSNLS